MPPRCFGLLGNRSATGWEDRVSKLIESYQAWERAVDNASDATRRLLLRDLVGFGHAVLFETGERIDPLRVVLHADGSYTLIRDSDANP